MIDPLPRLGPWIAYATLARIGWLARQLDSDEDTCTLSLSLGLSNSLLFLWVCTLKPDGHLWCGHYIIGPVFPWRPDSRLKKAGRLPWPSPGQKGKKDAKIIKNSPQ